MAKAKKQQGASSLDSLLLLADVKAPPGYKLFRQFCIDMDKGVIPETPSTTELKQIFRQLLDNDDADPLKVLNLVRGKGRQKQSGGDLWNAHRPNMRLIEEALDKEPWPLPRGAMERAYRAAEQKSNRDRRPLQRSWKLFGKNYQMMRQFAADHELVQRHIPDATLAKFPDAPWQKVVEIAEAMEGERVARK